MQSRWEGRAGRLASRLSGRVAALHLGEVVGPENNDVLSPQLEPAIGFPRAQLLVDHLAREAGDLRQLTLRDRYPTHVCLRAGQLPERLRQARLQIEKQEVFDLTRGSPQPRAEHLDHMKHQR